MSLTAEVASQKQVLRSEDAELSDLRTKLSEATRAYEQQERRASGLTADVSALKAQLASEVAAESCLSAEIISNQQTLLEEDAQLKLL